MHLEVGHTEIFFFLFPLLVGFALCTSQYPLLQTRILVIHESCWDSFCPSSKMSAFLFFPFLLLKGNHKIGQPSNQQDGCFKHWRAIQIIPGSRLPHKLLITHFPSFPPHSLLLSHAAHVRCWGPPESAEGQVSTPVPGWRRPPAQVGRGCLLTSKLEPVNRWEQRCLHYWKNISNGQRASVGTLSTGNYPFLFFF